MIQRYAQFWFFTKMSEISFSTSFSPCFFKKIFFILNSDQNWPNFIAWLHLLLEILDKRCIVIICCLVYYVINFEIISSYLSSRFSTYPKSYDKSANHWRTKRAFNMKDKAFLIIFKRLSLKQTKSSFLEDESLILRIFTLHWRKILNK